MTTNNYDNNKQIISEVIVIIVMIMRSKFIFRLLKLC